MRVTFAKFILKETKRHQIVLILLTLLSFPVLYGLLHIPKVIINEAIGGDEFPQFVFDFQFEQVDYLILLSSVFFALIIGNAIMKFSLNWMQAKTTEYSVAKLRRKAFYHTMNLPFNHLKSFTPPELIQLMTTEIEPIGGFAGDLLATPIRQGGTLLTILVFVFVQDFYLGLAAISLYPLQAYIVPYFQRKMNRLLRTRSQALQSLSEEIQDALEGLQEIKSLNLHDYIHDRFDERTDSLLSFRLKYYMQKFLLKLSNSLIGNFIPFLFYTIGGYFVIQGDLTLGALVSILAAHKDLQEPWIELLDYYQKLEEASNRYQLLTKKINYTDIHTIRENKPHEQSINLRECDLVAKNLYFTHEHSKPIIESANFSFKAHQKTALVAPLGQGEGILIKIMAGLMMPTGGDIFFKSPEDFVEPHKILGKQTLFLGQETHIFSGSILENIYLNLPAHATPQINRALFDVLAATKLDQDLEFIGLNKILPFIPDTIQETIIKIRHQFKINLLNAYDDTLIDFFDTEKFSNQLSLAENILYGAFSTHRVSIKSSEVTHHIIKLLKSSMLHQEFLKLGHMIATTMLDLFAGLPEGHPFFEQYSLINYDQLPQFQEIVKDFPHLNHGQETILLTLALNYIPAQHRVADIDEQLQTKIVNIRQHSAIKMPPELKHIFMPYDIQHYHPALSVWENIFFGRFIHGLSSAQMKSSQIYEDLVKNTDFSQKLVELGLYLNVGLGGKNLSRTQRQKIGLARALISDVDLLVFDKSSASLDHEALHAVHQFVLSPHFKKGIIWLLHRPSLAKDFDHILTFKDGTIIEQGNYPELMSHQGAFKQLLDTEYHQENPHAA